MEREPQTLSALSRRLRLAKSTTHRLLHTLLTRGFVQPGPDGAYFLGQKALWLTESRGAVQALLDGVRDQTGETVNLGYLTGHNIVYVARSLSTQALRWGVEVGSRVPCYCSGMGKAVLAFRPDIAVREEELVPFTERTITDPAKLAENLREVRSQGFAFDDQEYIRGVSCIALPIASRIGQVVGSLSISGPSVRFNRAVAESHLPLLKDTARRISQTLGAPVGLGPLGTQ